VNEPTARLQDDELLVVSPHDDLEAYVLGALGADERASFKAHLEMCDECGAKADTYGRTIGLLPYGLRRQPVPDGARVLARARAEVNGPPTVPAAPVVPASETPTIEWSPGGPPPASDRPWAVGDLPPDGPANDRHEAVTLSGAPGPPPGQVWEPAPPSRVQPIPSAPLPPATSQPPQRPRIRLASIAWAAALAFVLSVGLIVTAWGATGPHASPSVEIGSRLPGGRILSLAGTGAPTARGRLFVVGEGRQAELVTDSLRPLAPGRVYQLWFFESGQPIRTGGTFLVNQQGDAVAPVTIPAPLDRARAIAVTEEAAPSSPQPTGAHLLDWTP
jgi:hypothetical protein